MNEWLIAACVLIVALIALAALCALAQPIHGLVAVECGGVVCTTVLLLLAEGFHRQSFVDLALVFGVLSFAGSLFFARMLERRI